ncbi:FAD-dependent monooxygenase [Corynebacterium callunae]|uniref:FAD-dependent monooxygenase n=1 Tax=Corynebacterium callunae TaxID=1721 RepID=UPI0010394057|nr:FAD-dependent monooxygenase [Corynebacterium callunae]MCK2201616.1 FAD-dependent monooxygenase [Corynebacterium callunae]
MSIRVACIGGGPGGLFTATLLKRYLPTAEVVLFERNREEDVFGFGVVFSDATLRRITEADPVLDDVLNEKGRHWDAIEVWSKGEKHSFAGNGMSAIHRKDLLRALQAKATEAGVELKFGTNVASHTELEGFDLIVAANGTNSLTRREIGEDVLGHEVVQAEAKFIWFATTRIFDGLTFLHRKSEHGSFAAHAYPISNELSTFIVEADEATWRAAGLDEFDVTQTPGPSDMKSKEYIEALFAEELEGNEIVVNNSRWANFSTRSTKTWFKDNVALLGDAIHTAHFSVGSGTKMAMEDAIILAQEVAKQPDNIPAALQAYQDIRKPAVAKVQNAARPSLSWWEHFGRYYDNLDPVQFTFHFFSRSINRDRIAQRDPELVAKTEAAWKDKYGADVEGTPITIAGTEFPTRVFQVADNALVAGDVKVALDAEGIAVLAAPEAAETIDAVVEKLPATGTVVIYGGDALNRRLLAEEARFARKLTVVLVEAADEDAAITTVLSGRADAVAQGEI